MFELSNKVNHFSSLRRRSELALSLLRFPFFFFFEILHTEKEREYTREEPIEGR